MTNTVNNHLSGVNGDIIIDHDDDEFVIPENVENFFAQLAPKMTRIQQGVGDHSVNRDLTDDRSIIDNSSIRYDTNSEIEKGQSSKLKTDLVNGEVKKERVIKTKNDNPRNDRTIIKIPHVVHDRVEYAVPNKNKTNSNLDGNRKLNSPLTMRNHLVSKESPVIDGKSKQREAPCSNDKELRASSPNADGPGRESPKDHGPDTRDFVHVDMDLNRCETSPLPFQRHDTIIKDQLFELFGMDPQGNVMHQIYEDKTNLAQNRENQHQDLIGQLPDQTPTLPSKPNLDGEFLI